MVSLHEKVRSEILRRVSAGDYAPGAALPSAAVLSTEFGVSAITVKRALRDLQTSGVLRAVHGLGTFVREKRRFVRNLDFSFNSLADAERLGMAVSVQLISVSLEDPSGPVTSAFGPLPDRMLCVRKIIAMDGDPVMHDTTFVAVDTAESLIKQFSSMLVMEAFKAAGARYTGTELMIEAAPASVQIQQALDVPNGYPTLRRIYRITASNPTYTLFGVVEAPFDKLTCSVELPGPDAAKATPYKQPRNRRATADKPHRES